ncbi:MAG: helix-turn-helix transcriptional regulator [Clostridia bacterium]|nr:helix-turn-helix transcriptional regulator [Clostridia bacterium]
MFELNSIYNPITALPNVSSNAYTEIRPCIALQPYIRCFWGTKVQMKNYEIPVRPVIPDTCMDIIFNVNYTKNTYNGKFCPLDEHTYYSPVSNNSDKVSIFAIRFYAWSAVLFADSSIKNNNKSYIDVDDLFHGLKNELAPVLCGAYFLKDKIEAAEKILIKKINMNRFNHKMMNGLFYIIRNNGNIKISDMCSYTGVSKKTLERIFNENMGVSPKTIQSLMRYQLLWQDIYLHKRFNVFDAVLKYGYFDQSHLLNDFKRRHSMTPKEALILISK